MLKRLLKSDGLRRVLCWLGSLYIRFAHATGLLLLLHTGRIRMFGASAPELMEAYVDERVERLVEGQDHDDH